LLITQSSWLLTLSPNCQITIPKSFQTHTFAFRRGNLHSYLLSPFEGAQRYEVFCLVKPPPLFSTPHLDREGKGTKFLTFTSTALPRHRLAISQRSNQTSQSNLPHYHPPRLLPPPFQGAQMYEVFRFVKPPSIFHPTSRQGAQRYEVFRFVKSFPLAPPTSLPLPQRGDKVTNFLAFASLPTFKDPFPAQGERKGTKFFALSSPPSIPPRFFLGSAKVQRF